MACMEHLLNHVAASTIDELPAYLRALERVLLIEDTFAGERLTFFMRFFSKLMNTKLVQSYISYSYVVDSFIYLAMKSKLFLVCYQENFKNLTFLRSWLSDNSCPDAPSVLIGLNLDRWTGCIRALRLCASLTR